MKKKLTMAELEAEALKAFRGFCEVRIELPNLDDTDGALVMNAILKCYVNAFVAGYALANAQ